MEIPFLAHCQNGRMCSKCNTPDNTCHFHLKERHVGRHLASQRSLFPLLLLARMSCHLYISLFLEWGQAWSSLLRETLNFPFAFFLIAYQRVLKLGILIGKLKYDVGAHSGGRPIIPNETLVSQIAWREREREGRESGWVGESFGSIPASQHLYVVPSSAITPLARSFLSQHFYCICCPRQTVIKPR